MTIVIHTGGSDYDNVPVESAGLLIIAGKGSSGAYSLRDPNLGPQLYQTDPGSKRFFNSKHDGCCGFLQKGMLRSCGAGNHYLTPMNVDEKGPLAQPCR